MSLESLDGLESLEWLGGTFGIAANCALVDISGLGSLAHIEGNLEIVSNDVLPDLDGLSSLLHIGGGVIWIKDNLALSDVSALLNFSYLGPGGGIYFLYNASLPTCQAWMVVEHAESIGWSGEVNITGNDDAGVCD